MSSESSSKESPTKGEWVQFDEDEAEGKSRHPLGVDDKRSPSNSSGVSSARGSVNSISDAKANSTGASISISEIQVNLFRLQ